MVGAPRDRPPDHRPDAELFVGPAAVERFRSEGDHIVACVEPFASRADMAAFVTEHGPFEFVVANLDAPITGSAPRQWRRSGRRALLARITRRLVRVRRRHRRRRRLDTVSPTDRIGSSGKQDENTEVVHPADSGSDERQCSHRPRAVPWLVRHSGFPSQVSRERPARPTGLVRADEENRTPVISLGS